MNIFNKLKEKRENSVIETENLTLEPVNNDIEIKEAPKVFKPSELLLNLSYEMSKIPEFLELSKNIYSLALNSNAKKSSYVLLLEELKKKLDLYQDTLMTKPLLDDFQLQISKISHKNIDEYFKEFDIFVNDLDFFIKEYDFLKNLTSKIPELLLDEEINEIYLNFSKNTNDLKNFYIEIISFKDRQDKLSDEIIKFTETFYALKQKHKLSVDWNGKKPQMITLGNNLNAKRTDCLNEEAMYVETAKEIYPDISYLHKELLKKCYFLSVFLKEYDIKPMDNPLPTFYEKLLNYTNNL